LGAAAVKKLLFLLALPLMAQEGHPLVGTWHGNWGANAKDRTDVTVVMNWDGKNVSGMINPGPDSLKLSGALDPSNWTVRLEGDGKDSTGKPVHVQIEGKIENLTNVRRSIVGAWTQGSTKADLKITRDN
jgi:hypothetical protein